MTTINKRISRDVLRHLRIEIWCFFCDLKNQIMYSGYKMWGGGLEMIWMDGSSYETASECFIKLKMQDFPPKIWIISLKSCFNICPSFCQVIFTLPSIAKTLCGRPSPKWGTSVCSTSSFTYLQNISPHKLLWHVNFVFYTQGNSFGIKNAFLK